MVRHRQGKVDSKLFAGHTDAAIDDSFDAAVGWKGSTVARAIRIGFGGSGSDQCSFGDFHAWSLEFHQAGT